MKPLREGRGSITINPHVQQAVVFLTPTKTKGVREKVRPLQAA